MYKTIILLMLLTNIKLMAQVTGETNEQKNFLGYSEIKPKGDGTYQFTDNCKRIKVNYKTITNNVFYGIELLQQENNTVVFSGDLLNQFFFPNTNLFKDRNSGKVVLYFDDMLFVLNDYNNGDFKAVSQLYFFQRSEKSKIADEIKQLNIDSMVRMYLKILKRQQSSYVMTDEDKKNKAILNSFMNKS